MPLLKRTAFEKHTAPEYLRDDDEVFYCEITDEIFKDYEEYCERIILVNSMVWTCEMTGKNNLTYAEALESEKAARRSLKDFPMELRIPILYLAARTQKSSFGDMSEAVFNFVRERYFIGETVEACLEGDTWREAHVLSVTSQKQQPGSKTMLPPSSYVYEVEQFEDSDSASTGQVGTAPHDRVRRRKGVYTRDKNRLFLKQFVESQGGIICIKKIALEKYNIHKTSFEQIFTGNPPEFAVTKKPNKSPVQAKAPAKPSSAKKGKKPSPDKKGQQSMDKFVKKTDKADAKPSTTKPKPDSASKKSAQELAEKMRRAEEQMRKRKEEERAKKKEKHARLQAYIKEWHKVKDDLDLEDHKVIPAGTPLNIEGIPQSLIGDFLSVLEFVYVYADILHTKDVFHHELDVEAFRKALVVKEHAGVLSDLVQMFLTTIFTLQEDEAEDYNEKGGIQESTGDIEMASSVGATQAMELATKAGKWSQTYLGTPLSKLPLEPATVSEVLRLHLLSSGGAAGTRCSLWRYHQRGGYSSTDDAGLHLRVNRPALLASLHTHHTAELTVEDKLAILQCLMNQVLSYATVRDIIEEKLEELKNAKQTLRMLQINERKREAQVTVSRQELKKEFSAKKQELKLTGDKAKEHDEQLQKALEKLVKDSEDKKLEYKKKLKELQLQVFDYASYLGSDRAYRRYWLHQRVAGLFVEDGDDYRGPCSDKPVTPAHCDTDPLSYITTLFESERGGSDKENDSVANSRNNTPKKPLSNLNGLSQKLNGLETSTQQLQELLMCTGDVNTCHVHGKSDRPRWWVYHTESQIDALIASLNKRGVRESELRQALELDKDNILEYVKKCPLHMLNPQAEPPPPVHHSTRHRKFQPSLPVAADQSVADALELALRDHILELEEKIFHGCLGALKVKDREAWRGTIMVRSYDKQQDYLSWGPGKAYRDDYHLPNGVLNIPDDAEKPVPKNKYRDPGYYLEAPRLNGTNTDKQVPDVTVVRGLASALLQVSQGIHHKYIKRPLGLDDKERKDREAKNKPLDLEALERWEVSLMECKSFSAVVLHLFTLDSSITWSASILNASCRICRRKTDPDNMLLCDGCNKGHHLYCLKPKLAKVPEGDWFCEQCKPKERTPRKKRKLFSDEDIEEALNSDEESFELDGSLCSSCGSGGVLGATCFSCSRRYHAECAVPKPARAHRRWTCAACLYPTRESDDSEVNTPLVSLKEKGTKRGKRSKAKEEMNSSRKSRKSSLMNGVHEEKPTKNRVSTEEKPTKNRVSTEEKPAKKRSSRASTPLHTEALDQLLNDVIKHRDSWPFHDPVSVQEVPDYLSIIPTPMDLSTIRSKLSSLQYRNDAALIADAALMLSNCYTYNQATHPVARAGVRLEKYINKRCADLCLPPLPEISVEDDEVTLKRHNEGDDADAPKAKKTKLK